MGRYKLLRDLVGAKGLKFPAYFVVESGGEQWPERRCQNMVSKGFMAETKEDATRLSAPEPAPAEAEAPAGNPDGDKGKGGAKGGQNKPK